MTTSRSFSRHISSPSKLWDSLASAASVSGSRHQSTSAVKAPIYIQNPLRRPLANQPTARAVFRPVQTRSFHASRTVSAETPKLIYRIAVSSSGKGRPFDPSKNYYPFEPEKQDAIGVETATDRLSKIRARPDSGQDAFFVSKVGDGDKAVAFGIADGVGGWSDSGVDPSDFSHGLCSYIAKTANAWDSETNNPNAKALMQTGYEKLCEDKSIRAGGSTACVGVASSDGKLETANLGDSGALLLRSAAVHHYTIPQTHAFNTPYQLSRIPRSILAQASIFGGLHYQDLPRDADVEHNTLRHGDVLILATDGVWDNLSVADVLSVASRQMLEHGAWRDEDGVGIQVTNELDPLTKKVDTRIPAGRGKPPHTLQSMLAVAIAWEAKRASINPRRDGPFAREVRRYFPNERWRGGKIDDIAVLVVVVVEEGKARPTESKL